MVTDPQDDSDKWMEYRHPRHRQLQREDAETLAMLKMINPDHDRIWRAWDDLGRKGNRNGAGAVRLLDAPDGAGAMSNHTPGPWTVEEYGDEDTPALVIHKDSESRICFMATPGSHGDPERIAADANLIAAAPDLLEALKALLPEGWGDDDTMDHMPGVKLARLAIAKAGGRAK